MNGKALSTSCVSGVIMYVTRSDGIKKTKVERNVFVDGTVKSLF